MNDLIYILEYYSEIYIYENGELYTKHHLLMDTEYFDDSFNLDFYWPSLLDELEIVLYK